MPLVIKIILTELIIALIICLFAIQSIENERLITIHKALLSIDAIAIALTCILGIWGLL